MHAVTKKNSSDFYPELNMTFDSAIEKSRPNFYEVDNLIIEAQNSHDQN